MGRREKKTTKINREKILLTATRLIKERGIANISLADISAEVKISKGTLYYYYPSKSALVFDITEQSMNHMTDKIVKWVEKSKPGTPPEQILRLVMDALLKTRGRAQVHLYLLQESLLDDGVRRRFSEEYGKWLGIIESGLSRIFPDNPDTATLSRIILATIYGLIVQTLLGADKPDIERIAAYLAGKPGKEARRPAPSPETPEPDPASSI
jgi:AcrR family transcriptional regulator